uniref:AD domain-containing protein n=1 Tax=Plectus sambesii TaxID=2011161 RepID=A0A914V6S3_9BILA
MWSLESAQERMALCGQAVEVKLTTGSSVFGVVYTVDPVSNSIVLIQFVPGSGPKTVQVIPGLSIVSVTNLPAGGAPCCPEPSEQLSSWLEKLFKSEARGPQSEDQRKQTRKRLVDWLHRNRVPLTEHADGSLQIFDVVKIVAPFSVDDCQCANELVLGRVRSLIEAMPSDSGD